MTSGPGARLAAAVLATAFAAGGEMQAPAGTEHDCSPDASLPGIFAQRFDASGMRKGAEFRVDAAATSYQDFPSVAMDAAGNFVVTWETFGQDGRQTGVLGQRFDASGTRSGAEFRLDAPATDQDLPTVAVDAAGNFVVTWDFGQDGSGAGICGQLFDASGMPRGAQFRVNTSTT